MSRFPRTVRRSSMVPRCGSGTNSVSRTRNCTMTTLAVTPRPPAARTTASATEAFRARNPAPHPVAEGAEISDGRDLGERIDREEEAFPKGVLRVRVHHVLHDRDAREGRGPHDERGEVEGGEVREVARLEMERLHQETRERSHSASPAPAAPPGATYLRMVPRLSPRRIKGRDPETKVRILK